MIFLVFVAGYVLGAKTGSKDLDQLSQSIKSLFETDEFGDVVVAARAHVGTTLREIASILDGQRVATAADGDLVAQVRHLVGHD